MENRGWQAEGPTFVAGDPDILQVHCNLNIAAPADGRAP